MRKESAEAELLAVFALAYADPAQRNNALIWARDKRAKTIVQSGGSLVQTVLQATLTNAEVVAALRVAAADTTKTSDFKLIYQTVVHDAATANALAAHGAAPQFMRQLADVIADEHTLAIATHFLGNVTAADAEIAKVNALAPPTNVLNALLDAARAPADTHRAEMIKLLAENASDAVIQSVRAGAALGLLYNAAKSESLLLEHLFAQTHASKNAAMVDWVVAHKDDVDDGATILAAFEAAARAGRLDNDNIIRTTKRAVSSPGDLIKAQRMELLLKALINTPVSADALAGHGVAPQFARILAAATVDSQVLASWNHYFIYVTDAAAEIDKIGAGATFPAINGLQAALRVAAGANPAHRLEAISLLAGKASDAAIQAIAAAELPDLYTAVLTRADQALMQRVFAQTGAGNAKTDAMIDWLRAVDPANQGFVMGAFYAAVRVDNRLDSAQVLRAMAAAVDAPTIARLRFIYEAVVFHNATANALAIAAGVNPEFIRQLAALEANDDSLAILTHFLDNVTDPHLELDRHDGAPANTAFKALLNGNPADARRKEMIKVMTNVASPASIATVTNGEFDTFYGAAIGLEDQVLLERMFLYTDRALKNQMIAWVSANGARSLGVALGAPTVLESFHQAARAGALNNADVIAALAQAEANPANIPDFKFIFDAVVYHPASAAALLDADPAVGGHADFSLRLAALRANKKTLAIFDRFLTLLGVDDADAQLRHASGGNPVFKVILTGAADPRRNEMIKLMATKAKDATLRLIEGADLDNLYNAILNVGDEALLRRAFTHTNVAANAELITWVLANINAPFVVDATQTVKAAFHASVRLDDRFLAADVMTQLVAADLARLQLLHEAFVDHPGKAAQMAVPPFSLGLVGLPATPETLAVWTHQFSHMGIPEINLELLKDNGLGGRKVFELMLKDPVLVVGDIQADRDRIIALMAAKADGATIAQAVSGPAKVERLLRAIRKSGLAATMAKVFASIPAGDGRFKTMLRYAMERRTKDIATSGTANEVLLAMRDSDRITDDLIKTQVMRVKPNWKKMLFYMQVRAHDEASAIALANIADGGVLLHNLIVGKIHKERSVQTLSYLLSFLVPGLGNSWERIRDNADGGRTAREILLDGGANIGGVNWVDKVLAFFTADNIGTPVTLPANPPARNPIVNQGLY